MKTLIIAAVAIVSSVAVLSADKIDLRLATVKKAFIVAVDELADDRPVATCFAERLPKTTPLEAVKTKDEADVVFKIKAHLPGFGARRVFGSAGGSPSADIAAELPDGTKLWADGVKLGSKFSWDKADEGHQGFECGLADQLADALRQAMRKARDSKK